ncbi:putative ribonuclease H-like domain-containing protein [Tanacetum coccineum]
MAFISSSNTNSGKSKVPSTQGSSTASVQTANVQVSTASTDVAAASLSYDTVCAFIATQSNGSQIKYEDISQIDDDDIEEMDIKWNLALLSMRADRSPRSQDRWKRESYKKDPKVEKPAPKAMIAIDGIGWDWSYMAEEDKASRNHALVADEEEVPTEYALMAKSSSSLDNDVYDDSFCSKSCRKNTENLNNKIIKINEELSDYETDLNKLEELKKEKESIDFKIEKFKNASKDLDSLFGNQSLDKDKKGLRFNEYSIMPPPPAQVYSPPKKDMCWMGLPEFIDDTVTDYSRPTPSIDVSKDVSDSAPSFEQGGSFGNIVSKPMIRTKFPTVGSKVPTAKPTVAADKGNKGKTIKASACWIWKPKQTQLDQGSNLNGVSVIFKKYKYIDTQGMPKSVMAWVMDSGCSRHMTGNVSYLSEYEPYNGGYVSFRHGGGMITSKGIIKDRVLFTDSECLVLGKDFKLVDDTHVLLRTPRQQNMYSIDLKNIVLHKNFNFHPTPPPPCLIAKAFEDESMLWHKRLGHLNFKTMNKLVRNNLVKGLPSKSFENNHTCVACLKGKQHKASCKFDAKGDEGYFVGYSLSSKAFRVFNKRTKKVDENLHVDFLENQPIEKGTGPNWLFDIDTLTKSMNYVPVVVAGTPSTNFSGTKEDANQAMKENVSSLRFIALPNWFHEDQMATSNYFTRNSDAFSEKDDSQKEQDRIISNTDVSESSGNTNPTAITKVPTINQVELVLSSTVETKVPTVSSHVPPVSSSGPRIISRGGSNYPEAPSLGNAMSFEHRLEDFFGDTTNIDSSDKVEADLSNMETDTYKAKNMEEQSFIAIIHQKTNPELLQFCLFSCFLSQDEPNKIFDALKDPSWVEAMQEELLQFKIQNVWVLVDCPKGFPDKVYKVVKAMYGLHQAPRAWYGTLSKYLLDNGFQRGTIDQTLFIRKHKGEFLLVQVYVDDIIFGSSNPKLCREFEALMHDKFKMSAMGELNFFLGLQVLQKKDGIFLSQDKYVVDILKKFGYTDIRSVNTHMDRENPWGKDGTGKDVEYRSMIGSLMYLTASRPDIMFAVCACARHQVTPKECHLHAVKRIFRYLKGHPKLGLWYPKESPFDLVAYLDSDYGGANQDRKSTTGGCQFLGRRLISWQCKKQTIVATSTTEAEYVAAASGCGQVLWIQNQLLDYGYNFMNTKIYIDNNSAICIVKNPVYHSKTKHIEIRHHFIRDCYEKKLINVDHIHTDDNVADLLTKAFDVGRFQYLVDEHVMKKSL